MSITFRENLGRSIASVSRTGTRRSGYSWSRNSSASAGRISDRACRGDSRQAAVSETGRQGGNTDLVPPESAGESIRKKKP